MTASRLAVLGFHKIGEPSDPVWETWNYVPTAQFAEMLDIIEQDGWTVIGLPLLRQAMANPTVMPQRAVLITFDDGYRSTLTEALPELRSRNFPAVVFVPTAFVGGTNGFDLGIEPTESMCDWDELAQLNASGVAVQAHTVNHPQLSELGKDGLVHELGACRRMLEHRLGQPVDTLAYPYGNANHPSMTEGFLRELGYKAAFLYGGGTSEFPFPDPFRIARLPVGRGSDVREMLRTGSDGLA